MIPQEKAAPRASGLSDGGDMDPTAAPLDLATAINQAAAAAITTAAVIWLFFMLIFGGLPAAWLAVARGREPFLWMVIGLLLGPLAVLLVGLAPLGTRGDYRRCPRCAEAIRREAVHCPHCPWEAFASAPIARP